MSVAYLPSPARGVWQLGPVPLRAYALCALLGVVIALWLTERRYRRMGGPPGMILDVATVAVPVGIVGARLYSVLSDYGAYFGKGRDWTAVLRIWDGGLGVAGIVAAGAVGAWVYCRRYRYALAPMALAAAPGLAVALAIGTWGNWFSQRMYGPPSTLPFAVAIGPARRASGYESFATFQPVFLYESVWDLLVAAAVVWAIRRFRLTGDRAFALYAGLYAVGRLATERVRIDYSPRVLGIRVIELAMLAVLLGAMAYLAVSRARREETAAVPAGQVTPVLMPGPAVGRGRSPVVGQGGSATVGRGRSATAARSAFRLALQRRGRGIGSQPADAELDHGRPPGSAPRRHPPRLPAPRLPAPRGHSLDGHAPDSHAPGAHAPEAPAPDGAMAGREGPDTPGLIRPT